MKIALMCAYGWNGNYKFIFGSMEQNGTDMGFLLPGGNVLSV